MNQEKLQINSIEQFTDLITSWYKENYHGFADKYNAAVVYVKPIPEGTDPSVVHDWKNATIDDLCDFFQNWYKWNPDLSTGLECIQRFSWLYYENKKGLEFVTSDPGNLMTFYYVVLNGQKMDSPASKDLVAKWMNELGSKMDDYIIPEGGYKSFNEFFIRELKEGKRPISGVNDDSAVVSPADAVVNMIDDNLSIETPINVKTQKVTTQVG